MRNVDCYGRPTRVPEMFKKKQEEEVGISAGKTGEKERKLYKKKKK
jgi:hypothetical protein